MQGGLVGEFNTFLNIPPILFPPPSCSRLGRSSHSSFFPSPHPSWLHVDSSIRRRVVFLKVETNNTITFRFRLLKKQDIAVWLDDSEVGVLPVKTWRPSLPMDTSCPLKALDTETRYIQSHENYCSLQMARTCVSATAREKTRKPACPDHQTEFQRFPVRASTIFDILLTMLVVAAFLPLKTWERLRLFPVDLELRALQK